MRGTSEPSASRVMLPSFSRRPTARLKAFLLRPNRSRISSGFDLSPTLGGSGALSYGEEPLPRPSRSPRATVPRSDSSTLPSGRMWATRKDFATSPRAGGAARSRARRPDVRTLEDREHADVGIVAPRLALDPLVELEAARWPCAACRSRTSCPRAARCCRRTGRSGGGRPPTGRATALRTGRAAPLAGPSRRTRRIAVTSVTSRKVTSPSDELRLARRRDRAVLGVEVDEHVELVALTELLAQLVAGQQQLGVLGIGVLAKLEEGARRSEPCNL